MDEEYLAYLLNKYADGTLTMEEAIDLKQELERKKEKAISNEDPLGLLIVGLMLVGLEYLMLKRVEGD